MPTRLDRCVRCGEVFATRAGHTCPACLAREDDELILVQRFLARHDKARTEEVCEGTGVPVPIIMKFVRLGRISEDALPPELLEAWIQQLDAVQKLEAQSSQHPHRPKPEEPTSDSTAIVGRRRS
jgi:hypothetical protein